MIASRLQRYIFARVLTTLGLVIGLFVITILLVDVVEQMRTVGNDVDLSVFRALQLATMKLPALIEETLPFAMLIATMISYNALNKSSELSVIRAMGQSAWQFLMPAFALGTLLGLFSMMILNPLGAHLSERFEATRSVLLEKATSGRDLSRSDIFLRQGTDNSQILIHAARVDMSGRTFSDVKFIEESRIFDGARPTQAFRFTRRIDAKQAQLIDGFWQLEDIIENDGQSAPRSMARLAIETDLDPNSLVTRFTSPSTISFWDLPGFIERTRRAGLETSRFGMRFWGLTALPVLYTAMALIGALVCLRLPRLGGTSQLVAAGTGAATALFFLIQFASSLGASGAVPTLIAAWSPALCALFIALTIISYQEDG